MQLQTLVEEDILVNQDTLVENPKDTSDISDVSNKDINNNPSNIIGKVINTGFESLAILVISTAVLLSL